MQDCSDWKSGALKCKSMTFRSGSQLTSHPRLSYFKTSTATPCGYLPRACIIAKFDAGIVALYSRLSIRSRSASENRPGVLSFSPLITVFFCRQTRSPSSSRRTGIASPTCRLCTPGLQVLGRPLAEANIQDCLQVVALPDTAVSFDDTDGIL